MPDAEIKANAQQFRNGLGGKLTANLLTVIGSSSAKLDDAYSRLTTLQAWRSFVLEEKISAGALGFFSEAQNDGLTSSVLISVGMWRPAMKSLRSLIENTIQSLFFMDHPVEYRQWDQGKYRPTFKELFDYFAEHPEICNLPESLKSPATLRSHYSHLSNVVHSSAREFRMTNEIEKSNLWKTSADGVGKWAATQKNVLRDVNLLMLPLFHERLQGAANKGLREALSLAIPASKDALIKSAFSVKVIR
ncbi:hypothetical protein [Mesorhizobium atlanticum]|uniref:Uncharacterized protein n=1 Tax=Mesorhizobium atlanticum TaxID=2233532 RepID=A0A330GWS9_9HYPH|nr:hypothetical protein [Mesorhizobium atlanticum]RAZ79808.1 hypothetical protein DPM35_00440 [Mesorhizobium atlanticum]